MFFNYIKTLLRGMWRHKTHTAINLVGLTSAFVVVFFIAKASQTNPVNALRYE